MTGRPEVSWPCAECGSRTRILTTTGPSRPRRLLGSPAIVRTRECTGCGARQAPTVEMSMDAARKAERSLAMARRLCVRLTSDGRAWE